MKRFARYLILLIPCILSNLAASSSATTTTNLTPFSTNLSTTSLGEAHFLGLKLPVNNAYLFVNYFDYVRIPRQALLSTLGPARREAVDLVALVGKDAVMQRRYQWGLLGC